MIEIEAYLVGFTWARVRPICADAENRPNLETGSAFLHF